MKTVVLKGTVGSNPTPSARRFNVLNLINGLSPTAHGKEVFHHTLMLEAISNIANCYSAIAGFAERWPSWLKALAC